MDVQVKLFGAFRDCQPEPQLVLALAEGALVADLRAWYDRLLARPAYARHVAVPLS